MAVEIPDYQFWLGIPTIVCLNDVCVTASGCEISQGMEIELQLSRTEVPFYFSAPLPMIFLMPQPSSCIVPSGHASSVLTTKEFGSRA